MLFLQKIPCPDTSGQHDHENEDFINLQSASNAKKERKILLSKRLEK